MDSDQKADVVCLARATTPQKAHLWRQLLEAEGIFCRVVGDYLDAGVGTLETVPAEVWVRQPDLERARAVLAANPDMSHANDLEEEP